MISLTSYFGGVRCDSDEFSDSQGFETCHQEEGK